jgi:DNA-binding transcriptional regulator YiaG
MVDPNTKKSGDNRSKGSMRTRSSPAEKLSPAGLRIVSAFNEAIEAMQSGEPLAKRFSVRNYKADFGGRDYGPDDVRRVRGLLGMSQVFFARFLGVNPNTVRSWEQGARPPRLIARHFMEAIEDDPEYWRQRVARSVVESAPAKSEASRK